MSSNAIATLVLFRWEIAEWAGVASVHALMWFVMFLAAKLQVAVGAHQIKTNLPLRFTQGGAAAGQASPEGRQLGGLAQGQQVEIQHQPQVAEAVLELGVAVLS